MIHPASLLGGHTECGQRCFRQRALRAGVKNVPSSVASVQRCRSSFAACILSWSGPGCTLPASTVASADPCSAARRDSSVAACSPRTAAPSSPATFRSGTTFHGPSTAPKIRRQPAAPAPAAAAAAAAAAPGADAAAAAAGAGPDARHAALRRWVEDHGGFVHDCIAITNATQCGSRGLVASSAISMAQLEAQSLVVVPRQLHLDNRAAVEALRPHLGSAAQREAFEALGQLQQVACCLAIERAKGLESFWLPYIRTLPDTPPNPWLLTGSGLAEVLEQAAEAGREEAAAAAAKAEAAAMEAAAAQERRDRDLGIRRDLGDVGDGCSDDIVLEEIEEVVAAEASAGAGWRAGLGGDRTSWAAAVEVARRRYGGLASEVLEVVGADAAALGLEREGLMWAMGQVVSRSLGSGRSAGLLPLIDLANHDSAARPPMMMLDDQDRVVFAVTNLRGGELAPLQAGEELFISYQAESFTPLQAWLKWGFVPHCLEPTAGPFGSSGGGSFRRA